MHRCFWGDFTIPFLSYSHNIVAYLLLLLNIWSLYGTFFFHFHILEKLFYYLCGQITTNMIWWHINSNTTFYVVSCLCREGVFCVFWNPILQHRIKLIISRGRHCNIWVEDCYCDAAVSQKPCFQMCVYGIK